MPLRLARDLCEPGSTGTRSCWWHLIEIKVSQFVWLICSNAQLVSERDYGDLVSPGDENMLFRKEAPKEFVWNKKSKQKKCFG